MQTDIQRLAAFYRQRSIEAAAKLAADAAAYAADPSMRNGVSVELSHQFFLREYYAAEAYETHRNR